MRIISSNYHKLKRERRHRRIRARVVGAPECPRLSVFKSNRYLSVQLIDDLNGVTLLSATTRGVKGGTPLEKATQLGKTIAESAGKKSIKKVVFDRSGHLYTGRIKAVADGAREGGLNF